MKKQYDIVGNRKKFFIFSAVVIVFILAYAAIFGVKMDIEFKGGAMLVYSYQGDVSDSDVNTTINGVLGGGVSVRTGTDIATDTNTITVTLPGKETLDAAVVEQLSQALETDFPDSSFAQLSMNNVNPSMGAEFFGKCLVAVLMASILILVYIAVRFKKIGGWPAGCMAIIALVHDLIIIFGVFVVSGIALNGNFIAAMLTILGYSINDTVVVYDRIRENRQLYGTKMPFDELVNKSINQSLRRSINTTVSTVLALGSVCVVALAFGLDSIFTFALPLIVGMISGVYSTICIAGPLWVQWSMRKSAPKAK